MSRRISARFRGGAIDREHRQPHLSFRAVSIETWFADWGHLADAVAPMSTDPACHGVLNAPPPPLGPR